MDDSFKECLENVFDEADDTEFTNDLKLEDIPGWDSMTRVSLVMEIDSQYGVKVTEEDLAGEKTLGEIADLVAARKA